MCGIAGIVSLDGFDPATLVAMTQMIRYRGPSGFGFAYSVPGPAAPLEIFHGQLEAPEIPRPVIGLGNRRLAILDLSESGNQPMQIAGGDYSVTYNGEIYNYREIRGELESAGHRFFSRTDTEVLLRSYAQWGEGCVQRFNGMWSFALWDRKNQKLFCARDRLGVKPFYFMASGRTFYFASEIKQVLAASGAKRTANPRVVSDFLEWGLQDHSEETSFEGVRQLLGGQSLSFELASPLKPRIAAYWELEAKPVLKLAEKEAVPEFRNRFREAVTIRLRSDVPVGVSLSGGLDSSAILCQAKALSPETRFQAFSACFVESQIDERRYIAAVANQTESEKHWTFPECGAFWRNIERIAYHQDEPIGGTSVFAQWSVMQDAQKRGVPVLLGGQGGDESLCGYRKYYFFYLWHLLRRADPRFFRESISLASSGASSHWSFGTVSRYLPGFVQERASILERLATPALRSAAAGSRGSVGAGPSV
ncbi:MAG TPA: asparagine synthase (glutamine-hydrolyzing), partial [Candidatus Acidoferrum sp.]|nr:asparagine synthase (glutamine-hydrolyzing) [Candidatus Acidoferrum sp.]